MGDGQVWIDSDLRGYDPGQRVDDAKHPDAQDDAEGPHRLGVGTQEQRMANSKVSGEQTRG